MFPLPTAERDLNVLALARRVREERTGSTSATWTLTNRPIEGHEMIFENGLLLRPDVDYTIGGKVLTFASTPVSGDVNTAIYYYPAS